MAPNAGSAHTRTREARPDEPDNADRDHRPGLIGWLLAEFTPPEPWSTRPSSVTERLRYARDGEWTGPDGPARAAGMAWFWAVTFPTTVALRYLDWIVARPSRTIAAVGLWGVLMQVPKLRAAASFVLPFDPWPTWNLSAIAFSPGGIATLIVLPVAAVFAALVAWRKRGHK